MNSLFQQHNPFRSPRWRSNRVDELLGSSQTPDEGDDTYVRQYRQFVMKWNRIGEDRAKQEMFIENPGMFFAKIYDGFPDREWNSMLEARILSAEPFDAIAERLCLSPAAVFWYEKLFFHVTDRLGARDWLIKVISGTTDEQVPSRNNGSHRQAVNDLYRQKDRLYKLAAVTGGPHVLSFMIHGFNSKALPQSDADLDRWFDKSFKSTIKGRSTFAAHFFDVNKYNVVELMNLNLAIENTERMAAAQSGSSTGADHDYTAAIATAWDSLQWNMAEGELDVQTQLQHKYNTSPAEPRAADRLLLAYNREPADLEPSQESLDRFFRPGSRHYSPAQPSQ